MNIPTGKRAELLQCVLYLFMYVYITIIFIYNLNSFVGIGQVHKIYITWFIERKLLEHVTCTCY